MPSIRPLWGGGSRRPAKRFWAARRQSIALAATVGLAAAQSPAEPSAAPAASRSIDFVRDVRPLLEEHCFDCHSTRKHKGDLDLQRFTSAAEVFKAPKPWQQVLERLANGEMPPGDASQPTAEERKRLVEALNSLLDEIALAGAGDPGPVVLRRLNNAEYTYTIRDLTGVESLDPVRDFPADSASGEGFMNVGNSLVMSPSLVAKYLDAAKEIARHAVLLPDGIGFSPSTTPRDWTEEKLAAIRTFYARFTENGGGTAVDLQGIKFDTKDGGVAPLEKYLAATLAERQAIKTGLKPIGDVARERGLNAKYLGRLWTTLNDTTPSLLLDQVRGQWRAARPDDFGSVLKTIRQWQQGLWRFTTVGHIGKRDGPKAWQVPVTPLAEAHEVRLKLPVPAEGDGVTIYLAATGTGGGSGQDFAVWENPRLVAPGRPDLPLRDVRGAVNTGDAWRKNVIPTSDHLRESPAANASHGETRVLGPGGGWGLDPALFGKHPDGATIAATSLCVRAPGVIPVRLPWQLVAGCEFVATATLDKETGAEAGVQMQVFTNRPETLDLAAGASRPRSTKGTWSDGEREVASDTPILAREGSGARRRIEAAFDDFRRVFPAALCYTKIVPVDEVVTLTLFYREDDNLRRLMLDDAEAAQLDRLWAELHYVSQDALKLVDAFEQLWQFATQDADPSAFEPLREPIKHRAEEFRTFLIDTEPAQVDAVLKFAERAYRRPLTGLEEADLSGLYRKLREKEIPHDQAIRLTLARVLVAPGFLYRAEEPAPGGDPGPVSAWELATRLSYFLWSSAPDDELRAAAASGELQSRSVLTAHARRLLRSPRVRRLATEFACAWLHIHDFASLDEKSERHFPTFAGLREPMYEEAIRFFTDLFQNDGSVLSIFDADHTFLNGALAEHYGIPGVTGPDWRRVDGVKRYGRGGVLGLGATLAKQSGASRTSPILRGNWVAEVLLGDRLPPPPKGVPQLPEDEATEALTMRQLVEQHRSDPLCSGCHDRIDGYGFALEAFDAIGRLRSADLGGHPIETRTRVFDGTTVEDAQGLRDYLLTKKRAAVLAQFNRKLLGYALGRAVLLSDRPLLAEMQRQLEARNYRFSAAVETLVGSRQFREIRGKELASEP